MSIQGWQVLSPLAKKVRSYAGFVCAINLQWIKELLESCGTFSVGMDMASHMSLSYLDIQICFFHKGKIHNFHLLAIPIYTHHTAKQIFLNACKVFDVLCPWWQEILISVVSDGEQKMTGCIQGVATCFEHVCKPFFCIWCGLHQLDLKLQLFYKELLIV